jgi:choline monooxygenase
MKFDVDEDIRVAKTIPSEFYHSKDIFRNLKSMFNKSWQFVGNTDLLETCNVSPRIILEGILDEPYVLTKDRGRIRCLSNVCTHRGNIVCKEACDTKTLVCGYHGRQFSVDGKLKFMPEFEDVEKYPETSDNLPEIELGFWENMMFIINDKKCELSELTEPMTDRMRWLPMNEFRFKPELSRSYEVDANWALYCDNYLEGFHIPHVHKGLNKELDYDEYYTETVENVVIQIGIGKENETTFDLPDDHHDQGKDIAAYYFFLFPNMMFNFYPWGLSVNIVEPLKPARTRIRYLTYVWKKELQGEGAGGDLDKVELEDDDIVEAVQKGVMSQAYNRGRYSPAKEAGVHHFHLLLQKFYG